MSVAVGKLPCNLEVVAENQQLFVRVVGEQAGPVNHQRTVQQPSLILRGVSQLDKDLATIDGVAHAADEAFALETVDERGRGC